ncbi:hypothetical protein [Geomicrobium sediminis]|uniref:Phage gp6-like head-tail connector protein n=1 Tax=Geomicrobium sediminis TaxID=1347788 RepID=A0ABS2PFJ2_9BACL|nr:hypothetical protein [Geomicrobium sediminis]MBM7633835.1 hypothetical protein [Geomicrobium sediminis]
MSFTDKDLIKLRRYTNDVGKKLFDDDELMSILEDHSDVNQAASTVWAIRAGSLETEIESYSVGQETYHTTKLKDKLEHALKMVQHYSHLGHGEGGGDTGFIFNVKRPDVM